MAINREKVRENTHEANRLDKKREKLSEHKKQKEQETTAMSLRRMAEERLEREQGMIGEIKNKVEKQADLPGLVFQFEKVSKLREELGGLAEKIVNEDLPKGESVENLTSYFLKKAEYNKEKNVLQDKLKRAKDAVGLGAAQGAENDLGSYDKKAREGLISEVQRIDMGMAGLSRDGNMLTLDGYERSTAVLPRGVDSERVADADNYNLGVEELNDLVNTGYDVVNVAETGEIYTKEGIDTEALSGPYNTLKDFEHRYSTVTKSLQEAHDAAKLNNGEAYMENPRIYKNFLSDSEKDDIEKGLKEFGEWKIRLNEARKALEDEAKKISAQGGEVKRLEKFQRIQTELQKEVENVEANFSELYI